MYYTHNRIFVRACKQPEKKMRYMTECISLLG
uniref:Uncharacterized protein n=1 Tax=Ackermannviridae sp. TaxID=2831612 RepID=A0A8S5VVN4_9CAUD|nr:MAG TPA: hypothetical protein [Ackermannviridae sp.]